MSTDLWARMIISTLTFGGVLVAYATARTIKPRGKSNKKRNKRKKKKGRKK